MYELQLKYLETGTHATNNDTLSSTLGTNKTFSLEIIPPSGAVLFIERTTPVFLDVTISLD